MYTSRNEPKYLDRQIWENSADPDVLNIFSQSMKTNECPAKTQTSLHISSLIGLHCQHEAALDGWLPIKHLANTVKLFNFASVYFHDIREADIIAKINCCVRQH